MEKAMRFILPPDAHKVPHEQPRPLHPPELLRIDRAVDTRYIKNGSSSSDYADAPWKHYVNPIASYLSLRFARKENFLARLHELSPIEGDRVKHEVERIESDRQKFLGNTKKHALTTDLKQSLAKWREAVFNPSELQRIEQIRREERSRSGKELGDWDSAHLKQLRDTVAENNPTTKSSHHGRRSFSMSHLRLSISQPKGVKQQPQPDQETRTEIPPADPYHGFKAGAMYFERRGDGTLKDIDSKNGGYQDTKFPNQKIALKDILDNPDNNPLRETPSDKNVRYFHFPSNNMEWIEKAIEQYYAGKTLSSNENDRTRLLSREYWTGQMHGGEPVDKAFWDTSNDTRRIAPVHARHMRSKCLLIPRDARPTYRTSRSTNDIHDMKSPKRVQSMKDPLAEKNVAIFLPYLHWETSSRRAQMIKVINESTSNSKMILEKQRLPQAVVNALTQKSQDESSNKTKNKPHREPRRQFLARYLFAVARMAEEMDYQADERLLREKVNIQKTNLPMHIRRTLDQYYFLTLDNTSERDRDQVVYRGTRSFDSTTRVVMVDQLWMWILDDNTIITAFPRRWGRNKPDPSGVHKSLRMRLGARTEMIKSTHHLAMIIIDQCSRVFFDRTRPLDERPEVMDLFAAAIGTVTEKTRIAYDHFWRSIKVDPHYKGSLVINPEGIVLKEAQDIAEELMIMKRVYNEQIKVAKDFMRHLTHPHGRHAAMSSESLLINKFMLELKKMTVQGTDTEEHEPLDPDTRIDEESVHEAHDLVELLQARLAEIVDLEEAALRACNQLEGLLSLKQQQASIVEARAALDTANESYKQGRTIQAFTIVTIVFLPMGFIAAFFGMNNLEINGAEWMGLWAQIRWMFGGTAVVIFISISLAFGSWFRDLTSWVRAVLRFAFDIPSAIFFQRAEMSNFHEWWKSSLWNSKNLDRKRESMLAEIAKKKREREYHEREIQEGEGARSNDQSLKTNDDPV